MSIETVDVPADTAALTVSHHELAAACADLRPFVRAALVKSWPAAGQVVAETAPDGATTLTVHDVLTAATVTLTGAAAEGAVVTFSLREVADLLRATGKGVPAARRRAAPVTIRSGALIDLDGHEHPLTVREHPTPAPAHLDPTWVGDGGAIWKALEPVVGAASTGDTLPMLSVVALAGEDDGRLRAGATDRFRLAEARCPSASGGAENAALDPVRGPHVLVPAVPLSKALARMKGSRRIGFAVGHTVVGGRREWCTVTDGRLMVSVEPYDGEWVRTAPLWPAGGAAVTCDRATLRRQVEDALRLLGDVKGEVRVTLTPDADVIEVGAEAERAPERGHARAGSVPARIEGCETGQDLARTFNAAYLLSAIAASFADEVTIVIPPVKWQTFGNGDRHPMVPPIPFLDTLADLTAERPDRRYLVMPILTPVPAETAVKTTGGVL